MTVKPSDHMTSRDFDNVFLKSLIDVAVTRTGLPFKPINTSGQSCKPSADRQASDSDKPCSAHTGCVDVKPPNPKR